MLDSGPCSRDARRSSDREPGEVRASVRRPGSTAVGPWGKLLLCAAFRSPSTRSRVASGMRLQLCPRAFGRTTLGRLAQRQVTTVHLAVTSSGVDTGRVSFAKIAEPIEVPDLLALQADSFDWLIGSERWQSQARAGPDLEGREGVSRRSGLEEIFEEISPIEDFSGTMSLSFRDHRFEPAQEHRRGVQGARLHVRRAALRHRRVHEQRDRRDQEPDRVHG